MLNKKSVSELAELSNLSKAYISQVKHSKRPPSRKLIESLSTLVVPKRETDYIDQFLKSRSQGLSPKTVRFYRQILNSARDIAKPDTKPPRIDTYLKSLNGNLGNKHAHYRALRVFFNWLYSPRSGKNLRLQDNPILYIDPPRVPKLILPSLAKEQVELLIDIAGSIRDKAIIALFTESGLRLSEIANIKPRDIDWPNRIIRVIGKGKKESYAPFGELTERYLKQWFALCLSNDNTWGMNEWGITSMLRRLKTATGLPCNPHTFRRTFACLLRKAGVDTMTIKDLGRWESLEMVQRYTRSVTFHDSLKFYKAPLA